MKICTNYYQLIDGKNNVTKFCRYKGRREFYRYTPKENPAMKTFNVNGINVLVSGKFCSINQMR